MPVPGDALNAASYTARVPAAEGLCTWWALRIPVPPRLKSFAPWIWRPRAPQSLPPEAPAVARFTYVNVEHPATAMKAYIAAGFQREAVVQLPDCTPLSCDPGV